MCGISGVLDRSLPREADLRAAGLGMAACLAHRGPDGAGSWIDTTVGLVLSHRRLAVIDLTATGDQPMTSADGRLVLDYNGELYNFLELRAQLEAAGVHFRGTSDTEVLLAALSRWGTAGALRVADGMFAFALWDRDRRVLTLARDRMGEKPLYYGRHGARFVFASELKALLRLPGARWGLEPDALRAMLQLGHVPAPLSILAGVRKLPAGTFVEVDEGGTAAQPQPYWSLLDLVSDGEAVRGADVDDADVVEELERLLRDAVRRRLIADVPVGAFLSGGIDSSVVTAMAVAESRDRVRTYTARFDDDRYDEGPSAREVSERLGTDHTELHVTAADALALVPGLPEYYDEPFADSSQIPTLLLSRLTRQHVVVALAGDGGDELFAGYARHGHGHVLGRLARSPQPMRLAAAAMLTAAAGPRLENAMLRAGRLLPAPLRQRRPAETLAKAGHALHWDDAYLGVMSLWRPDELRALVGGGSDEVARRFAGSPRGRLDRPLFLDQSIYLPDDLLVKTDRASMAVGLEVRLPLLAPEVVAFSWRLPERHKFRDGAGKWPLRQVLARSLPPELFDRPKTGFGVPLAEWLRGPLRTWAEDMLSAGALAETELFRDAAPIRLRWAAHLRGGTGNEHALWSALMAQAWARHWKGSLR